MESASKLLSDFSCPLNKEIENFAHKNALEFANRKISMTYLVLTESGDMAGFFSLTHKAIQVKRDILSSTSRRRMERYANLDESTGCYTVSAFLIAQLSKNFTSFNNLQITGDELMELIFDVLGDLQRRIGGGVTFLECEEKPQLLKFYRHGKFSFMDFATRYSERENTKYIQLLRFF